MAVVTEIIWPAKPKILTLWLFTEASLPGLGLKYSNLVIPVPINLLVLPSVAGT